MRLLGLIADAWWGVLTSLRWTLGVLAALGLGAAAGTFIPQQLAPQTYRDLYGRFGAGLVALLELDRLYASWWYTLLLLWLGLGLLACSLARLRSARLGVHLTHLGLLLLLAGAALEATGERGTLTLAPGGPAEARYLRHYELGLQLPRPLPFSVAARAFTISADATGRPLEYRSDLAVRLADGSSLSAALTVGSPLRAAGYTLYQQSYRPLSDEELRALGWGPPPRALAFRRDRPGPPGPLRPGAPRHATILEVATHPGAELLAAGGALVLLGVSLAFWRRPPTRRQPHA